MAKITIPELGLAFTGNGTGAGSFTVADPSKLKIGARATISSLVVEPLDVELEDVDIGTLTVTVKVPGDGHPDLSAYLVADEAMMNVQNQILDYMFTQVDISRVSTPIPVVVGGMPLPIGGASEATQLDVKTNTGNTAARLISGGQKTQLVDAGGVNAALVSVGGALKVDGSAVTQPVSLGALPLPTGAATEAKQPAFGTAGASSADVLTVQGRSGMTALKVDGSAATQPVSVAALPLPSGAATESTLGTISSQISTVAGVQTSGAQKTQVTNFPATQPVSAAALPLPSGAATETTLGQVKTDLDTVVSSLSAVDAQQTDGSQKTQVTNFPSDQLVHVSSLPLPAGAATEATLATRLTEATFTARTPTLGLKTMAGSTPVVVASDQGEFPVTIVGEWGEGVPKLGVDAFGRLRVGMAHTQADLIMQYEIDARDWGQQVTTGGTITYLVNQHAAQLAVTGASGSAAVLQTHTYYRYQAGKSQWLRQTLYNADSGQTNQTRRWGYFDTNNGLFFELRGTTLGVVRRSSTSGLPQDSFTQQSAWNVDRLDGSGASGLTLDITKAQIWEIEFQFLGVGSVYFRIDGHLVHILQHSNLLSVPYMTTANLPVRAEVVNTGASTGSGLTYICTSVESHGGSDSPYDSFGAGNGSDVVVGATEIPVLAIRSKSLYAGQTNRIRALPVHAHINGRNANDFAFRILMSPDTLTGSGPLTWTSADSRSSIEYCTDATAFTGGQVLAEGVCVGIVSTVFDISTIFSRNGRHLRLDAFGTVPDVLVITAVRIGNQNATARMNIHWHEIR